MPYVSQCVLPILQWFILKPTEGIKKHAKVKTCNLVKLQSFFLGALLKGVAHFLNLLFCYSRHDNQCYINPCSLAALVAITQTVFVTRSLWAGNSNMCSHHHWECPYLSYVQPV